MGTTSHCLQMMKRPSSSSERNSAGRSRKAEEITWLAVTSLSLSNQNRLIWVRTRPLSGMPLGMTTSYALMRSVATITSRSPRSYRSRTLPLRLG